MVVRAMDWPSAYREQLLSRVNLQSQRLQALWQLAMSRGKTDREKMQLMLRLALDVLQMDVVMVNEYQGGRLHLRELADDLRHYAVGQVFLLEDSHCRQAVIEQPAWPRYALRPIIMPPVA
jgi:hypothetical protein